MGEHICALLQYQNLNNNEFTRFEDFNNRNLLQILTCLGSLPEANVASFISVLISSINFLVIHYTVFIIFMVVYGL